jgi:hypothetical protein
MPIISAGNLINQTKSLDPMLNPTEEEVFQHQLIYMPPPAWVSDIGFTMVGDVPKDLSVTPTGLITGKISKFDKQMATSSMVTPAEQWNETGDNWEKNGRPKVEKYIFSFMIIYDTMIMPGTTVVPMKEMTSVSVTLLHNYNLDNDHYE